MSQKYTVAGATQIYANVIQLSDGTPVFIYVDSGGLTAHLAYSPGRASSVDIATYSSSSYPWSSPEAVMGVAVCRDASDNLYVVGHTGSGTTNAVIVQAFTKGAGYTWTAQSIVTGSTVENGAAIAEALWCDTGGGVGGSGHIVALVYQNGTAGTDEWSYAVLDAGVALAGSGAAATDHGLLNSVTTSSHLYFMVGMCADGFGATSGLYAYPATTSSVSAASWSVSSGGLLTHQSALATVSTSGLGSRSRVRLVRYASNAWAMVSPSPTSGHYQVGRYSSTARTTVEVDSGTPTNMPLLSADSAYLEWDVALDPDAEQIWVYAPLSGSTNPTMYRVNASLSGGVTWGTAAVADDTWSGLNAVAHNVTGVQAVRQPVGSYVDYLAIATLPSSSALYADYTLFASAPSAPTLQSPSNGAYLDVTAGVDFELLYNSTDGANQNAYALRKKASGGSYSYWNATTSTWQSSIVWNTISTLPGALFTIGPITTGFSNGTTYNWSGASQEASQNLQGVFATDFTFSAQAAPSLTVNGPSGTVTSAQPVISWTATPASGASITNYQARVFSSAQYGAPGFDPGTSTATWDSGVLAGSASSVQVGTALANNVSYRFYVQVTETGGETSSWVYTSGTVVCDVPATPTIAVLATTDGVTGCPLIQITVDGHDNLLTLDDASFESSLGTWTAAANCSLAQTSSPVEDGSFSMKMTATASGAMSAATASGTSAYPVTAGKQYTVMAAFQAGTTARSCTVAVNWYNAAGVLLSTSTSGSVTDTSGSWHNALLTATAPANAAFASVTAAVAAAGASEIHYVDEVGVMPGAVTSWSRGGLNGYTSVILTRSDGLQVRLASTGTPTALVFPDQVAAIDDYEAVPWTAYTYTAQVVASQSGSMVYSADATSGSVTLQTSEWWWLDPTDPSTAVAAQPTAFNPQVTEQSAAHMVMGQTTVNVVANAMGATDGAVTFETFDSSTYSGLTTLLRSQKTIYVSNPFGDPYGVQYLRFGPQSGGMSGGNGNKTKDAQLHPSTAAAPHHDVSVSFVAQPRPAV